MVTLEMCVSCGVVNCPSLSKLRSFWVPETFSANQQSPGQARTFGHLGAELYLVYYRKGRCRGGLDAVLVF